MKEFRSGRSRLERVRHEADAKISRLVAAIAAGADVEEVKVALKQARREREMAATELLALESLDVIPLHPTIARDYRSQIELLTECLTLGHESRLEVIPQLQALINRVIAYPAAEGSRGVEFKIEGKLAAILALATGQPQPQPSVTVTLERVKGIEPSS